MWGVGDRLGEKVNLSADGGLPHEIKSPIENKSDNWIVTEYLSETVLERFTSCCSTVLMLQGGS
jgi:hypothetical protein